MKYSIKKLPVEMQKIIEDLKRVKNQRECLEYAYKILTRRYKGEKLRTYIELHQFLISDLKKLWNKKYLISISGNGRKSLAFRRRLQFDILAASSKMVAYATLSHNIPFKI